MATLTPNYGFYLPAVADSIDSDLWGGELNTNFSNLDTDLKAVSDVANSGQNNPGDLKWTAAHTAPAKWLLCYGQSLNTTTYALLFAAIGYDFGGSGTSFSVPDLRGRTLVGKDDMGGTPANRVTSAVSGIAGATFGGTGGDQNTQQHTHTASVTDPGHVHQTVVPNTTYTPSQAGPTGGNILAGVGTNTGSSLVNCNNTMTSVTTGVTVANANFGTGASQNMQPSAIMNVIIYAGV